jgi:uncharacterized membrane-anchored protein
VGRAARKIPTEAYYWLAIIVLRTAATNLADLCTHDLNLVLRSDRNRADTSSDCVSGY